MGMSRYPISVPCRLQSLDPTLFGSQTGRLYVWDYNKRSQAFSSHVDPWSNVQGVRPPPPPAKIRQRSATFSHLY